MRSLFQLLAGICLIVMAGCNRTGSPRAAPPEGSYRISIPQLSSDGASREIKCATVAPAFFEATATLPMLGRLFLPAEYQAREQGVALVNYTLWHDRWKSDPSLIGKTIQLDGRAYTIIGVMPPAFQVPSGADLWVPSY